MMRAMRPEPSREQRKEIKPSDVKGQPVDEAIRRAEAADVAVFLLSPRSSGIQAQSIVVDAGMSINYFDNEIIRRVMESD